MTRKVFWFATGAMLFSLCLPAAAQQPGKVVRIGYLDPSTRAASAGRVDAFRQEISRLGWIEGKNLEVEYRFAEQPTRLRELAAELVSLKVDVILCSSTPPVLAAKKATTTIPIVMASSGDPVEAGLVASLARPAGNVTGLASYGPELAGKRLELLKEAAPAVNRVGFLWFSVGPGIQARLQLKELRSAALALNINWRRLRQKCFPMIWTVLFGTPYRNRSMLSSRPHNAFFLPRETESSGLPANFDCLPSTQKRNSWRAADLCTMERTAWTRIVALPYTWTGFSEAPSRPTCRWSSP
jgi:ABC transporter substrate binding protein